MNTNSSTYYIMNCNHLDWDVVNNHHLCIYDVHIQIHWSVTILYSSVAYVNKEISLSKRILLGSFTLRLHAIVILVLPNQYCMLRFNEYFGLDDMIMRT